MVGLGEGVQRYRVGDKVCALVPGGGYAQYCVAAEDNALPIPAGRSMEEAAGVPETYFTVWTNVFQRGALKAGCDLRVISFFGQPEDFPYPVTFPEGRYLKYVVSVKVK